MAIIQKSLVRFSLTLTLSFTAIASGCQSTSDAATSPDSGASLISYQEPSPLPFQEAPPSFSKRVLVYAGVAAAYDGPEAIGEIARNTGLNPVMVSSNELDSMSLDELSQYGAIFWPGGYAGQQSESLSAETRDRIRLAVTERGMSFVGFCAGSFIAASPAAKVGEKGPAYGFALLPMPELLPYYHLEDEGTPSAMVQIKLADGSSRDMVWWGGPVLPEIPGGVLGRHGDDQTPAIIQAAAGKGMVILTGPHPEAPLVWRDRLALQDSDGAEGDWALASKYMEAAVNRKKLSGF